VSGHYDSYQKGEGGGIFSCAQQVECQSDLLPISPPPSQISPAFYLRLDGACDDSPLWRCDL
jgi:hypothetical protein